jgi:hypothetical protein
VVCGAAGAAGAGAFAEDSLNVCVAQVALQVCSTEQGRMATHTELCGSACQTAMRALAEGGVLMCASRRRHCKSAAHEHHP